MMNNPFGNQASLYLFKKIQLGTVSALIQTNSRDFEASMNILNNINTLNQKQITGTILDSEAHANDLYIIRAYIQFIRNYIDLWRNIYTQNYSVTWELLQNNLDLLRLIKRFSCINLAFYEKQLTNLEKVYPYRVFTSIGMTYTHAVCVLCNQDIDSFNCKHIKGNLYWGKKAVVRLEGAVEMDHLALTSNPKDKRCIIRPPEGYESEFIGLDNLRSFLASPSNFDGVKIDEENSHLKILISPFRFSFAELAN